MWLTVGDHAVGSRAGDKGERSGQVTDYLTYGKRLFTESQYREYACGY